MHHNNRIHRISTNMNADTDICERMQRSIICRVENFEIKRSHRRSMVYETISIIGLLFLIPVIYYIIISSTQSGFGKYISLIYTDSSYILTNWKEFTLSIMSSIPIMGVIVILSILFIVVSSLRRTVRYSDYSENVKHRLIAA